MEVLVSRQSRRLSRLLLAVLLLSFSAAALSFIYKMNHQPAQASPAPAIDPAAAVPIVSNESAPATKPSPEIAPSPMIDPTPHPIDAAEFIPGPATEPSVARATVASSTVTASSVTGSSFNSSSIISLAQSKIDAGRLLEARADLNDALQSGNLSESQAETVKAMLSQINQTVVFSPRHFGDDAYGGVYVVQPGDSLARIALQHDCTWELLGRINGIDPRHLRAGATIKVVEGPFFAVVEKHKFSMDLYLGGLPGEKSSMFITSYPVGLGRDDSTPVGTWMIEPHRKLKHPTYYSPRGEGVIAADDPKNPLGGYWIGLTGTEGQAVGKMSYGIHGTIDPDSIGKQSSMGCIRLKADDIAMVFDMMVEGKSMVVVKE
jgi:lipoprotein-anchoring transpeptidase ErfK/SrfK